MRPDFRRKSAFTLIELLVVIAIIAILAAILFPVFAKAREKARQASCESNIKEIVLACLMYAQDYDERLPASADACNYHDPVHWASYYVLVNPYVKNWQIFSCPSSTAGWCVNGSIGCMGVNDAVSAGVVPANFSLGYGYPEYIVEGNNPQVIATNPTQPSNTKLAAWIHPAQAPLVADSCGMFNSLNRIAWANHNATCDDHPENRIEDNTRHNGGSNIGFIDGHVKWYNAHQIWSSYLSGEFCCGTAGWSNGHM